MLRYLGKFFNILISIYQGIHGNFFGPCCRYSPSCSQYAREAIEKHGVFKGFRLSCLRVLRCNPFWDGGWDPVP